VRSDPQTALVTGRAERWAGTFPARLTAYTWRLNSWSTRITPTCGQLTGSRNDGSSRLRPVPPRM